MITLLELIKSWLEELVGIEEPEPIPQLPTEPPPPFEEEIPPGALEEVAKELPRFERDLVKRKISFPEKITPAPSMDFSNSISKLVEQFMIFNTRLEMLLGAIQKLADMKPRGIRWQTSTLQQTITIDSGKGLDILKDSGVGRVHFIMLRLNSKNVEGSLKLDNEEIKFNLYEWVVSELDTPLNTVGWWLLYYDENTPQYVLAFTPQNPVRYYQRYSIFLSNTGTSELQVNYAIVIREIAEFLPKR